MKDTIAAIYADLEVTPLGTRSRLAELLGGVPVLRRTVDRLLRSERLAAVVVLVPKDQYDSACELLRGTPAIVRKHQAAPPPWAKLVRVARKWSLDGWRGGIGGTTSLDEYMHPALFDGLLTHLQAEAVMVIPPAAALIDPVLVDSMVEHHATADDEARMTFTQAPPGVSGTIYDASLVKELAEKNVPPGWILGYKPDAPRKDLAFFSCCYHAPSLLTHTAGRLIADTDCAFDTVRALLAEHPDPDGETIGSWLAARDRRCDGQLPREIEVELTTDDPFPEAVLRPRGSRVGRRGPMPIETIENIAQQLSRFDDSLLVLGGYGDPLRHPQFERVLEAIRRHKVFGIAVRTAGVDLDEGMMAALIDHEIDVVTVLLDGWSESTYAAMSTPNDPCGAGILPVETQAGSLCRIVARIERFEALRIENNRPAPIIVPEMVKAKQTTGELADFFDGWIRKVGTVNVTGYSHFAGQLEDHAVMSMAPPARFACRRINSRCLVLADGRVTVCDQDFAGRHTVGRVDEQTLEEIWTGSAMTRIREAHAAGRFNDAMPLCAKCDEWHRP